MNNEDILKALSDVDPEMLRECSVVRKSQARRANPAVFLLVAASLLLIGVAAIVLSVRYRGRTTADTPEDESASSLSETAESAGEEETNTSRKPHENELVYEQEITLTIPNDGRVTTNMTIEFSDGYPIREAVRKAGYENFSD
ncbi:MAG: hypothetical protein IKR59_05710, partial [Lachnospiraceae bacterium]|nr:hypothetical protein [Lachnospiraceae bacterium]